MPRTIMQRGLVMTLLLALSATLVADELRSRVERREQAEALITQLAEADDDAALERIERELAELGAPAMIALRLAERSDNFELRNRAAAMADRVRWRRVADDALLRRHPQLVEVMASEQAQARAELVDAVSETGQAQALAFLRECLADDQAFVRHRAVDGLASVASNSRARRGEVVELLHELLQRDDDTDLQMLAVSALNRLRVFEVDRLAPLLDAPSMELRRTAIQALGYSRQAAAVEPILPMLEDEQWRVRAAALEALGEIARGGAGRARVSAEAGLVMTLLDDEDAFVAARAAELLGRLDGQAGAARIIQRIEAGEMDAGAGLRILAQTRSTAAVAPIISRFNDADDLDARRQWLDMLRHYHDEPRIAALAGRILEDEAQRELWPAAIELAARHRRQRDRLMPLVAAMLADADDEIANAAWQSARYQLQDTPELRRVMAELAASDAPARRLWALHLHYAHDEDPTDSLVAALHDTDQAVLVTALSLLGEHVFDDGLERRPELHRGRSFAFAGDGLSAHEIEMLMDVDPSFAAALPAERGAGPGDVDTSWTDRLVPLLDHDAPAVGVRAAALLALAGAVDDAAAQLLRQAIDGDDTELVNVALAGVAAAPDRLLDELDVESLARAPATRDRTLLLLAASDRPGHIELLIELADQVDAEAHAITVALLRSDDERALALAKQRGRRVDAHRLDELAEAIRGLPGPAPVAFVEAMWQRRDVNEWYKRSLAEAAATLPDPSVAPLLERILADAARSDMWIERDPIMRRLHELDPDSALRAQLRQLEAGPAWERQEALEQLLELPASDAAVAAVLEAAQRQRTGPGQWADVADWLPLEAVRGPFIEAIDELNAPLRFGVLRRLARELRDDDLDWLLTLASDDHAVRAELAQMVARLTAAAPDARPELAGQPPRALELLLDAAGDWADGDAHVLAYLGDERSAVAAAAVRGLSLHALANDAGEPITAHRDALLAAVRGEDLATAYLAAEALARFDADALANLADDAIATLPAALVRVRVTDAALPAALRREFRRALEGGHGTTPQRLAVAAAAQADDHTRRVAMQQRGALERNADLLHAWAHAHGEPAIVALALERDVLRLDDEQDLRLLESIDWRNDTQRFALAARTGLIQTPRPGDIRRLLQAAEARLTGDAHYVHYSPYAAHGAEHGDTATPLDVALAWAGAEPVDEVLDEISTARLRGVAAATVAALAWKHEAALDALREVATAEHHERRGYDPRAQAMRNLALTTLAQVAREQDVDGLIAFERSLAGEEHDWMLESLRAMLHRTIAAHRPRHVLARLDELGPDRHHYHYGAGVSREDLALAIIDDEDGLELAGAVDSGWPLFNHVVAARTGGDQAATRSAMPPWPAAPNPWDHHHAMDDPRSASDARQRARMGLNRRLAWVRGEPGHGVDPYAPWGLYRGGFHRPWDAPGDAAELASRLAADPAAFHLGDVSDHTTAGRVLDEAELLEALAPLVGDDDPAVRRRAVRAAASWQLQSLTPELRELLAGDDPATRVEAAWALAAMRGREAVEPIAAALDRSDALDERIMLASLLALLGEPGPGAAVLDDAQRLMLARRLRSRAATMTAPEPAQRRGGGLLSGLFGRSDPEPDDDELYHDRLAATRLDGEPGAAALPWASAVALARHDALAPHQQRLALAPMQRQSQAGADGYMPLAEARWQLDGRGRVTVGPVEPATLPALARLSQRNATHAGFAPLIAAEHELEPTMLVQHAHTAEDLLALRDRWQAWWNRAADQPRDRWWADAVAGALDELTHERWAHRTRALARLERLTGRRHDDAPPLFDQGAWQRLADEQRRWWAEHRDAWPAAIVLEAARQGGWELPGDTVDQLAHLAAHGGEPLADAAMLVLAHLHGPEEHRRIAEVWQFAPDPGLRDWARAHLRAATGELRLVYRNEQR